MLRAAARRSLTTLIVILFFTVSGGKPGKRFDGCLDCPALTDGKTEIAKR
jgi:hypothetical protein